MRSQRSIRVTDGGGQRTRASLCVYNWTPPHQTDFKATEALRWLFMQRVR